MLLGHHSRLPPTSLAKSQLGSDSCERRRMDGRPSSQYCVLALLDKSPQCPVTDINNPILMLARILFYSIYLNKLEVKPFMEWTCLPLYLYNS